MQDCATMNDSCTQAHNSISLLSHTQQHARTCHVLCLNNAGSNEQDLHSMLIAFCGPILSGSCDAYQQVELVEVTVHQTQLCQASHHVHGLGIHHARVGKLVHLQMTSHTSKRRQVD